MKANFEPIGRLTAKKQYHYACIGLAVIVPAALIVITLIKGTFSAATLAVCAGIVLIMLGIDYSNRCNMVVYDNEQLALLGMLGSPKYYRWDMLTSVQESPETMRLDFSDGKKLYINMEYDGIEEFYAFLNSMREEA